MKTYACACGEPLYFENVQCVNCGRAVGFLPDLVCISSLEAPDGEGRYLADAPEAAGRLYRKCGNYLQTGVCNGMVPAENTGEAFCTSCRLNVVIPDLSVPENVTRWAALEAAKRRLVYSALRLKLPLANRVDDPQNGLGFRFMADTLNPDGTVATRVMTEHDHGLITLSLAEADDAQREKLRTSLKEPYRTLLGHFRHESGHYYWDRLVLTNEALLGRFRELFGDERQDYDAALKAYYASGPPPNWGERFISLYATMHPWEDWAESWAHYLHVQDTLEVASDFGLVGRRVRLDPVAATAGEKGTLKPKPFDEVMDAWTELTVALNCLNRSMGLRDLYPFVLSKPVIEKLRFVSEVIGGSARNGAPAPQEQTALSQPPPAPAS